MPCACALMMMMMMMMTCCLFKVSLLPPLCSAAHHHWSSLLLLSDRAHTHVTPAPPTHTCTPDTHLLTDRQLSTHACAVSV